MWHIDYFCGMNNKEAIRRKKLYFEGLEKAIAQPIPEALVEDIEAYINNLDDEDGQLILRLWKEVSAPLSVARAFIFNNRVLPQYKEQVIHDDTETPFMQPEEIYSTLKTLMLSTVGEFLSVLQINSGERKELLDFIEIGDKDGFVSLLERTRCDTMPLARLCSRCMDDVTKMRVAARLWLSYNRLWGEAKNRTPPKPPSNFSLISLIIW